MVRIQAPGTLPWLVNSGPALRIGYVTKRVPVVGGLWLVVGRLAADVERTGRDKAQGVSFFGSTG
jgi:hypothetical protein